MNRRSFIKSTGIASIGLGLKIDKTYSNNSLSNFPIGIATWDVKNATKRAWEILSSGRNSLDAVEQGCRVEEANKEGQSVGIGGLPDREGNVTLDACIMDYYGNCGSVVYLKEIKHAISVARMVMEKTPHVMLAGEGAKKFAISMGFKKENLLTEKSKKDWIKWKENEEYKPIINIENHDTIGMLAIDKDQNISGGCTTSGLAYKMQGRVGDSPIIGSGTWAQNNVCGVSSTGHGEFFIKYQVAKEVCTRIEYLNKSIVEASQEIIDELERIEAYGGIIAIDYDANIAMPFNTDGMIRGGITNKRKIFVEIY